MDNSGNAPGTLEPQNFRARGAAVVLIVTVAATVYLGLAFLIYGYIWRRLAIDTGMPGFVAFLLALSLATLTFAWPVSAVLYSRFRHLYWETGDALGRFWLGYTLYIVVLLLLLDLANFIHGWFAPLPLFPPYQVALIGGGGAALLCLIAWLNALAGPVTRYVQVPISGLAPELSGFRIVQISDIHVGPGFPDGDLGRIVERVNALKPDLVAITGDLIEGRFTEYRNEMAALTQLRSRCGSFFVTGNHEYMSRYDRWLPYINEQGVRVLRNESCRIEAGGAILQVAGVDDPTGRRFSGHGTDLKKALSQCDPELPIILLSHQPNLIFRAGSLGVDLQLSGHTHNGQIWPFNYLVRLFHRHLQGLHTLPGGARIYVNAGTGFWGPRMRLPGRGEISCLTLRPE